MGNKFNPLFNNAMYFEGDVMSAIMVSSFYGQNFVFLSDYEKLSNENAKIREENNRVHNQLLMVMSDERTKNLLVAFSTLDKDSKDLIFSSMNLLKKISRKAELNKEPKGE